MLPQLPVQIVLALKTCGQRSALFKSVRFAFQSLMPSGCSQNVSTVLHKQIIFVIAVFNAVTYPLWGIKGFFISAITP